MVMSLWLTSCMIKILRFLVYQNTTLFSTFRPSASVSHRRDISTFLDNLMVYTMKTIYVLNAYHLGWSSWVPGSPEPPGPPWPPDHSLTPGSPGPPRQPFRAGCKPVQPIGPSPCQPCHLVILVKVVTPNFLFRNRKVEPPRQTWSTICINFVHMNSHTCKSFTWCTKLHEPWLLITVYMKYICMSK